MGYVLIPSTIAGTDIIARRDGDIFVCVLCHGGRLCFTSVTNRKHCDRVFKYSAACDIMLAVACC